MNFYDLYEKSKNDGDDEILLCEIIEFDDGEVIAKWCGDLRSLFVHKNLNEFKMISLNENRTLWQKN